MDISALEGSAARRAYSDPMDQESEATLAYRAHMNSQGSPSETVAQNYRWRPGTELAARIMNA